MANTASLPALPHATGIRRHLFSVRALSLSALTIFSTLAYLVGLYLPFRLYEAANGECHFLACAGTDTSAWWGFFANEEAWNNGVPFLTSAAINFNLIAVIVLGPAVCLLLPVFLLQLVRFGARERLRAVVSKAYRVELVLVAIAALFVVATVVAFLTPTGSRLWEVILD